MDIVEKNSDTDGLLADLGIAGIPVSRFLFAAAPRRIDVDPSLAGRLTLD